MLLHDKSLSARVSEAVARLETHTAAEVVVVFARRSGSYADVAWRTAALAGMLTLVFVLWSPWEFHPWWIPLELVLAGLVAGYAVQASAPLLRLLTSPARRARQVADAAALAFLHETVHGTQGRTGLLVYVSDDERRVAMLHDLGLSGAVADGRWNAVRWGRAEDPATITDLDSLLAGLEAVGKLLAAAVPATEHNPQELSDAPRIYR